MDKKDLPIPVPSGDSELKKFTQPFIVEGGAEFNYTEDVWKEVQNWLNIPLVPGNGPMESQIAGFFRTNVIASGHETISWLENFLDSEERQLNIPTADISIPRGPMGSIPTVGWHLFHYNLQDGSEVIDVIAHRQNLHYRSGQVKATVAEVIFVREPEQEGFALQKSGYPVAMCEFIETGPPMNNKDIGGKITRLEKMGGQNIEVFHVSNKHPSLSPPKLPPGRRASK